jgi:hypothetical protein
MYDFLLIYSASSSLHQLSLSISCVDFAKLLFLRLSNLPHSAFYSLQFQIERGNSLKPQATEDDVVSSIENYCITCHLFVIITNANKIKLSLHKVERQSLKKPKQTKMPLLPQYNLHQKSINLVFILTFAVFEFFLGAK